MYQERAKSVCPGIGIAKAKIIKKEARAELVYTSVSKLPYQEELVRYYEALIKFARDTRAIIASAGIFSDQMAILERHIEIANDPEIVSNVTSLIEGEYLTCESAIYKSFDKFLQTFINTDNELTKARTADLYDIRDRLVNILMGKSVRALKNIDEECIIVANELTPSEMMCIDRTKVMGIITESGNLNSHMAIMARTMDIPCAIHTHGLLDSLRCGELMMLNTLENRAEIIVSPSEHDIARFRALMEERLAARDRHFTLPNGIPAQVCANINGTQDLDAALRSGADGIGLFRSEYVFIGRDSPPDEQIQFEIYRKVALAMGDKPVTIRTLDISADKAVPYLSAGIYGIQLCLLNPEMFGVQLKAILRASAYGNVRILLPMITTLEELRAAKSLVEDAKRELVSRKISFYKDIQLGIMIETPAAVAIIDTLAKECDFFSIGTNDLISGLVGVDRLEGEHDDTLYSVYQPPVVRAIYDTIQAAKKIGIHVSMCGCAAGDTNLSTFLLACGLDEFSVVPSLVSDVKRAVYSSVHNERVIELGIVLKLYKAEDIKEYLAQ